MSTRIPFKQSDDDNDGDDFESIILSISSCIVADRILMMIFLFVARSDVIAILIQLHQFFKKLLVV